jgi:hypothetical protein
MSVWLTKQSSPLLAALVEGSAHDQECKLQTVIPAKLHDALGRPALNPVLLFCLLAHPCFRIPGPHALLWSQYLPSPPRLRLHRLGPEQQAVVPDSLHCAHHLQPRVPTFRHNFR